MDSVVLKIKRPLFDSHRDKSMLFLYKKEGSYHILYFMEDGRIDGYPFYLVLNNNNVSNMDKILLRKIKIKITQEDVNYSIFDYIYNRKYELLQEGIMEDISFVPYDDMEIVNQL